MDTHLTNEYPCTTRLSVIMAKVSISLPSNAQITFELEESEVPHEIVRLALRDLLRVLIEPSTPDSADVITEKGTASANAVTSPMTTVEPVKPKAQAIAFTSARETTGIEAKDTVSLPSEFLSANGRTAFEAFCREINPLGDMRRVVVAAEGASRHFGVDGVNAEDLGWLFDAASWRRPGNFTQTLRNAARSKFGWLERIPGRSGRYAVTQLGLSKTLPSN